MRRFVIQRFVHILVESDIRFVTGMNRYLHSADREVVDFGERRGTAEFFPDEIEHPCYQFLPGGAGELEMFGFFEQVLYHFR